MRALAFIAAIALLAPLAPAAPAPLPKPGLTQEQEAVLKSAEADMAEASQLLVRQLLRSPIDEVRQQEAERRGRELNLSAAQKLARLDGALGRGAAAQREDVIGKAGRAWLDAGEPTVALPYFDRVIAQSRDAQRRVNALRGAYESRLGLGRWEEARALLALARGELPRLGKAEREAAEAWINAKRYTC